MTIDRDLQLLVFGCGTAGYHNIRTLGRTAEISMRTARIAFVDRATIRGRYNSLTCAEYAGHDGRTKAVRLAELAREWFGSETKFDAVHKDAENIDYPELLEPREYKRIKKTFALMGLDSWEARVAVVRGLRFAGAISAADILLIQTSFDRQEAQVNVLGNDWDNPCVVCALDTLPGEQPCIVMRRAEDGCGEDLLRGNLHREALAAAAIVRQAVLDELAGFAGRRNTKMNLFLEPGGQIQRFIHQLRRTPDCWGPHDPARRPLTFAQIFQ